MSEGIDVIDDGTSDRLERYKLEIQYYDKESQAWSERVKKILRRYKDERSPREGRIARYNVLYSNIQTLTPAIYGNNPKPDIERRFKDDDDLGRITSDILERCASFFVDKEEFRSAMRSALFDRLIGGRGVVWSRYVPTFKPMEDDGDPTDEQLAKETPEGGETGEITDNVNPTEEIDFEEAVTDYVHNDDFGHNWSRTYDELYLGWRKVYLTRKELIKRFGKEKAMKCPLDYFPKGLKDQKKEIAEKKSVIYEMWDSQSKQAVWVHKDVDVFLDEKDDPLKLDGFFPFPKPLFGVLANDTLIPVPDFAEYQDQANELDELTSRIAAITKAIKVAGVYDASAPGISRLLAEGTENKLIAVEQWAILAEKGGIQGVMALLPMEEIAKTLLALYEARDKVKQDLYEITGLADIIRGATKVETATAQQIKSQFATLRISDAQGDMARFARDAVKNICIIIANHFSIETIKKISGYKLLTDMEKQQIKMQQQQMQQQYQQAMQMHANMSQQQPQGQPGQPQQQNPNQPPPAPPPISDDMQELLDNPSWEEVERLLKDNASLSFKIDIEVDSTIKMDEQQEKADRVEFLKAAGQFMAQAGEIGQQEPTLVPLLAHMLMFGVRGFKVGKELEGQFQIAIGKMEKNAANPQPKPNIEQQKLQADMANQKAMLQAKQQEAQQEAQMQAANDERDAQREDKRAQMDYETKMAEMKQDFDFKIAEMKLNADLDMKKHTMTTNATKEAASKPAASIKLDTNGMMDEASKHIAGMVDGMNKSHEALAGAANTLAQTAHALKEHVTKPKTVSMQSHDGRMLTAMVQ